MMSATVTHFSGQHWLSVLLLLAAAFIVGGQAAGGVTPTTSTTTTASTITKATAKPLIPAAATTTAAKRAITTTTTTTTIKPRRPAATDCLLPLDPGPCRLNLERYYYNAKTNTCESFKFGGCRGNNNKFGFRKTCEDTCVTQTAAAKPAVIKNQSNRN